MIASREEFVQVKSALKKRIMALHRDFWRDHGVMNDDVAAEIDLLSRNVIVLADWELAGPVSDLKMLVRARQALRGATCPTMAK
jgi:hypothetical protein